MLVPPASQPGWKVWTVGDDIAWLRPGPDGRLWAINPEAGFFGVAPGHVVEDQPERDGDAARELDLHQRRGHRRRLSVVGRHRRRRCPSTLTDWQGTAVDARQRARRRRIRTRASPRPRGSARRSRRTGKTRRACRSARSSSAAAARAWRRWCSSRSTGSTACSSARRSRRRPPPAQSGAVGVVRRDPMAMLPVLRLQHGRLLGALARHGPDAEEPAADLPRQLVPPGANGKFIWPGFGENLRVLRWVVDRCRARARPSSRRSACCPPTGALDTDRARRRAARHARAAGHRSGRLAAGGRGARRVLRQVRRPPAGRDRAAAPGAAERARLAPIASGMAGTAAVHLALQACEDVDAVGAERGPHLDRHAPFPRARDTSHPESIPPRAITSSPGRRSSRSFSKPVNSLRMTAARTPSASSARPPAIRQPTAIGQPQPDGRGAGLRHAGGQALQRLRILAGRQRRFHPWLAEMGFHRRGARLGEGARQGGELLDRAARHARHHRRSPVPAPARAPPGRACRSRGSSASGTPGARRDGRSSCAARPRPMRERASASQLAHADHRPGGVHGAKGSVTPPATVPNGRGTASERHLDEPVRRIRRRSSETPAPPRVRASTRRRRSRRDTTARRRTWLAPDPRRRSTLRSSDASGRETDERAPASRSARSAARTGRSVAACRRVSALRG